MSKVKPLAMLEAKARQLMLMVGFGFLAYTSGSIVTVLLLNRLSYRLVSADWIVRFVVVSVVGQLWILFVLPALVHLAARFLELPIWRTAVIGALTGSLFGLAIGFVSNGLEQTLADPVHNVVLLGTLVAGTLFTVWAGKQGRVWADARQKLAEQEAIARKGQYDQFLADSTALAEKREAARAAPAPAAAEPAAPAPAAAPDTKPQE